MAEPKGYRFYSPQSADGGSSSFVYSFPRHLIKAELAVIRRETGIQKMPAFIEDLVGRLVTELEKNLAEALAKSVRQALASGGMTSGLRARNALQIGPDGNLTKAGPRLFRPHEAVTAAFRSSTTSLSSTLAVPSRFKLQLGPGAVDLESTIPQPYRAPRDGNNTLAFRGWPLQPFHQLGIPTRRFRIASDIEYGNRFTRKLVTPFQGLDGRTYTVGFHPFEGAIKRNWAQATRIYAASLKKILRTEALITYKGRKWTLPVLLKQLVADQIEAELKADVQAHLKAKANPLQLRKTITSNAQLQLVRQLEQILPKNAATLKYLDKPMLTKLQALRKTPRNNLYGFALDPAWLAKAQLQLPGGL